MCTVLTLREGINQFRLGFDTEWRMILPVLNMARKDYTVENIFRVFTAPRRKRF